MSIKKDRYEISLWEDYIVSAQGEGENLIPEHYEERKIAVIGSNTMNAQWRAIEPKLVNNINGTNILTFKMYYKFTNVETGEEEENPVINLLVNERKIKCFWKNKWYDLVIKSCQEDSNGKSITYTCKDLFINELSKTGFNLEFDTELENNQGTVDELGAAILKGTDWQLGKSDIIKQYIEEPVYEIITVNDFTSEENITISAGQKILVFYSVFSNRPTFFQFWYDSKQLFLTDKSNMLVDSGECLSANVIWDEVTYNSVPSWRVSINDTIICYISKTGDISEKYHAKRLVRSQLQTLDPLNNKYVYEYTKKDNGNKVYGYNETKYDDVLTIVNYITNNKDFNSINGWFGDGINFQLYPLFTENISENYEAKSYLNIPKSLIAYNSGIKDFRSYITEGFIKGEKYIFRIKAMTDSSGAPSGTYCKNYNLYLTPWIGRYTLDPNTNTYSISGDNFFSFSSAIMNGDWVEYVLTCETSATYEELFKIGLFINNSDKNSDSRWIENIQFFKYALGEPIIQEYSTTKKFIEDDVVLYNNNYYICIRDNINIIPTDTAHWKNLGTEKTKIRINPGSYSTQSYANIIWKFYEAGQSVLNEDDLKYLYSGDEISANEFILNNLNPIYNENYEKIRSITGKNSNRFNLLQSLAETFECWIKFEIEHDEETGRIKYVNGIPQKWVTFINEVGTETGIGFVYGIDLKTISRTINSDSITSKVIVPQNNNEYGKDGFCSISRADENYSKTNYILNFDYYITQGLLTQEQINKDLYSSIEQVGIGYYYWLNKYNTDYDNITKSLVEKNLELTKQKSLQETYNELIKETSDEIISVESDLAYLTNYTVFDEFKIKTYLQNNADNEKVKNLWIVRNNLKNALNQYSSQLDNLNISINNLNSYINGENGLIKQQESYVKKIEELDKKFYEKYSRFIQEGSWTSEDYYDDNLYYFDATSIAYTSSRPQISYNISVLRLSALEEFKNKVFNLGDISFIQDTDFFGYTIVDGIKTPYKEKVLVSEITSNFDSPEKDSFKVQNYKTQFEDLFQRITATTQNLQYSTGAYNKAADSFTSTGEIVEETLQRSFELNQNLAWAAENDSVVYDTTGMTVVDTSNPNKIVRISSKGIQITEDGGEHWYVGITGSGISTKYLTSGIITTDKINIMDGNYPTFKWDKYGLTAFSYELKDGIINNVNDGNFVRFDRFGLYGINTELSGNWIPENEESVWNTAKFGLTWKGFFMKNKYGDGYVSISSTDDFIVSDGTKNRIKIGNIGTTLNPVYGLFIADATGARVMETNDDGTLWLKNRLNVETSGNYPVGIGKLGTSVTNGKNEVINANNTFIVYEDGSIKATDGEFTGVINATGGTIGGLSINTFVELPELIKQVQISSDNGLVFLGNDPSSITLTASLINGSGYETYKWYKGEEELSITTNKITINNNIASGSYIYKVEITDKEKVYTASVTIQKLNASSNDGTYYKLVSNKNNIQKYYISENNLQWDIDQIKISAYKTTSNSSNILNTSDYILKFEFFDYNTKTWIDITEESELVTYYNKNSDYWFFDINSFLSNDAFQSNNLAKLKLLMIEEEVSLRYNLLDSTGTNILYTENIQISFKIIDDLAELAKFSINARDITAAIDSTLIKFDNNGITINNGGLTIKKVTNSEEILLKYDEDNESLYIKGNGEFTGNIYATNGIFNGIIYATDGEFNGTITAKTGTIGGFDIGQNSLTSGQNLQLISNDGSGYSKIIVRDIELGEGAIIKKYIKLGNSYIYNPNHADNIDKVFINVTDNIGNNYISIYNNGTAKFGDITIDGVNSIISGNNFEITPDRSKFSNVDITGTIHSSVFEIGQTQSVGGAMLFRESAEIQTINKDSDNIYTIVTRTKINLKINSLILLIGNDEAYGKIISVDDSNLTYVIETDKALINPKTIIHLADYDSKNSKYINNLLIGINSQNSTNKNLFKNAITFRDFDDLLTGSNYEPDYNNKKPKLLLGDLSSLGDNNINGYGLYGDNVYLKGSLTTQVNDNSYAGINTLSGAAATKFAEDNSKIVFWAGSKGTNATSIQSSLFQVTEAGSLYAQKGLFEGSIITNSIIQASSLYAIRIFGGKENKTSPLNIYDTNPNYGGIVFRKRDKFQKTTDILPDSEKDYFIKNNENYERVEVVNFDPKTEYYEYAPIIVDDVGNIQNEGTENLRLSSTGFSINGNLDYFIEIKDNEIFFNGKQLNATSIMTNYLDSVESTFLELSQNYIKAYKKEESDVLLGYLKWESINNNNSYSICLNDTNKITQNSSQISLLSDLVQIKNKVYFGSKMKYENVENGYDLYISD